MTVSGSVFIIHVNFSQKFSPYPPSLLLSHFYFSNTKFCVRKILHTQYIVFIV